MAGVQSRLVMLGEILHSLLPTKVPAGNQVEPGTVHYEPLSRSGLLAVRCNFHRCQAAELFSIKVSATRDTAEFADRATAHGFNKADIDIRKWRAEAMFVEPPRLSESDRFETQSTVYRLPHPGRVEQHVGAVLLLGDTTDCGRKRRANALAAHPWRDRTVVKSRRAVPFA